MAGPTRDTSNDPLRAYMAEVTRHPLLTPEEELELTMRYAAERRPADSRKLVTSNLRLVVKVARDYDHARVPLIDLVQEGNVGLLQAVEKFDPEKGVRFATYAVFWIRAHILQYLLKNHSMMKVATSQAQKKLFYNLKKEAARLEKDGIRPTAKKLAASLEVATAEVVIMQNRLSRGHVVSLDTPAGSGEDGRNLGELLPSDAPTVEEWASRAELRARLHAELDRFADGLDERQRRIWDRRTRAEEPVTLRELGEELDLSAERVRMVEARMLRNLRRQFQARFPELEMEDMSGIVR
jgi:RNA polymerase sigma-32 factor